METINIEELKAALGKTFKDTLIVDPAFGPHFIIRYSDGGWGVMKTRRDGNGKLKWRVLGYPSTFMSCLEMIAKELQHEEGAVFENVQSYVEKWSGICDMFQKLHKKWEVKLI